MKKNYIILTFLILTLGMQTFAQNVGINSTGAAPNASAMLDIVSTNKGFLLPRVALTSTLDVATIAAAANWLIVFNTATAGDVTPGMYYWDGAKWVRMLGNSDAWKTLGNVGTVAATNFLGTTDNINLRFRTFNVERFEINTSNQLLGFNLGTAALPTFTWQADANNGIFSPGADIFAITTAATERMRVEADGDIGIGVTPDASSKLHVSSASKGVVIPNVALTATNAAGPTTLPITSMLVYNTATAGVSPNDVVPGHYYNAGTGAAPNWKRFATGNGDAWTTNGNAGTVAATNFLGTTDNINLRFRTFNVERFEINTSFQLLGFNLGTAALPTFTWQADPNTGIFSPAADMFSLSTAGSERMRVIANGNVGINQILPVAQLEVSSGDVIQDAIYGHSNNVGGYLGRESNISFGTPVQNLSGAGVYAANPMAGYTSAYAQSTGAATVAANISFSDVWMASYNYVQNASAAFNPSANYNQLNVTNNALGGYQIALRGWSDRDVIAGNPGWTVGIQGIAKAQNQWSYGVYGSSLSTTTYSVGGYFSGSNFGGGSYAYAYVGGNVAGVTRKIAGTGTVNEIIPTENHGRVTLTCPESPEYWYQDYGTVEMINGKAHVDLDEILADIIVVDENNPIRTFFTPQDMLYFNGAAVVNQTKTGFDIVELNGGSHSGKIQYQIIVKPKTSFGEGRFAQAPGPSYLKPENEPKAAKAKNQINDGKHIYKWPADHVVYKYNPEDFLPVGEIIPAGSNTGKTKLGNGKYSNGIPVSRIK